MSFEITSSAFTQGQPIPIVYSGKGDDISPPLSWSGSPNGTKSFVLLVDDPDAPSKKWTHWVVYNIPETVHALPEAIPQEDTLADGTCQGISDFGTVGYGGPMPPSGTHRYFFKLYALDTMLSLPSSVNQSQVEKAMEGHVLAKTELMGTFTH